MSESYRERLAPYIGTEGKDHWNFHEHFAIAAGWMAAAEAGALCVDCGRPAAYSSWHFKPSGPMAGRVLLWSRCRPCTPTDNWPPDLRPDEVVA